MDNQYSGVTTRFLNKDERLILSQENEMPLVIEAKGATSPDFLQSFLQENHQKLIQDLAHYGAILFRGFNITKDEEFEEIIVNIPQFRGISDAFMAENGRTHVGDLKYVLHTNSVYKTGGTLYLGGFHTENYYSADVPSYISFCCLEPSKLGGETGLINSEKLYDLLNEELQKKLEKNAFFVGKWLVSEIAKHHQITHDEVIKHCKNFDLPIIGKGDEALVLMYKPSIFQHPLTQKKALQINLFELPTLNHELRKCFLGDYQGRPWFWHRFFWRLPPIIFNFIESLSVMLIAFFHSPKKSYNILLTKLKKKKASKLNELKTFPNTKVGSCFSDSEVKHLAQAMRDHYSSCLWKKGDILLVDNKKVMHAGMPGFGQRLIRALICNPIDIKYSATEAGVLEAEDRQTGAIAEVMTGYEKYLK